MPATGNTAARGKKKVLITALLLIGLMVGLAACRGFFGQAPIALLSYLPITDGEVPVTVDFDISGSTDPDGNIASYELNYGDGSTPATGADVEDALSHEYKQDGAFTVTLTVTDGDGRIDKDTVTFVIGPAMLTYASDHDGDYDIWRMKADGSDVAAVLNTNDDNLFPDLVKGTREVIAYAGEDGTNWNISKVSVNGGVPTQLTTQTQSNQIQPSWSYDGSKIAYASNDTQTPSDTTWEIWTMNASGSNQQALTEQTPSWAIAPAYSPISNDLLFVSDLNNTGGGTAIWIWNGTTVDQLFPTTNTHADHYGDASPALTVSPALNLPAGVGISRPAWSPDGDKIAFSTDKDGDVNIYVMNADGSNAKSLEEYVDAEYGVTNTDIMTTNDEFSPYWLEDGSGIVFARKTSGKINLYKVLFVATGTDPIGTVVQLTDSTTHNNVMPASKR
jgi:Tol biopolymer transport system component